MSSSDSVRSDKPGADKAESVTSVKSRAESVTSIKSRGTRSGHGGSGEESGQQELKGDNKHITLSLCCCRSGQVLVSLSEGLSSSCLAVIVHGLR